MLFVLCFFPCRFLYMAQLVSVSALDTNSKVRSSNPAGNKKSFSIGQLNFNKNWNIFVFLNKTLFVHMIKRTHTQKIYNKKYKINYEHIHAYTLYSYIL